MTLTLNRRAYRTLVLELLRVGPFSAADMFDTSFVAPYESRPRRYGLVSTGFEATESDRLAGPQVDHDVRFRTRAVGKTPDEMNFAADHIYNHLINVRVVVPGRNSRPIRHVSSDPPQRDTSVGDGLFFCDDEWALFTTPA